MNYVGIDLHKTSSQVCILTADGELIERRIKADRESFDELCAGVPPARILVESSTESEWRARHLEAIGHEVIVADPNSAPMYATRDRRIKTDRGDARALCEACRPGACRRAHRTSDRQRDVRAHLSVREALIRTRPKYIVLIGALARRGSWPASCSPSGGMAHSSTRACCGQEARARRRGLRIVVLTPRTPGGIEALHTMKMARVKRFDGGDSAGLAKFVAGPFGVAA